VQDGVAHRAEQHPGQAAAAARADHHELRASGLLHERAGGAIANDEAPHR
jgi:hypothetical protein